MTKNVKPRNGGRVLIDALIQHGVEMAFCVPGESYLAALDALHDSKDKIKLIVCRQEGGAAYDGRRLRQADRQARHLLRDPRPRRHQCLASASTPPSRTRRR
jgi:hypothetical protein